MHVTIEETLGIIINRLQYDKSFKRVEEMLEDREALKEKKSSRIHPLIASGLLAGATGVSAVWYGIKETPLVLARWGLVNLPGSENADLTNLSHPELLLVLGVSFIGSTFILSDAAYKYLKTRKELIALEGTIESARQDLKYMRKKQLLDKALLFKASSIMDLRCPYCDVTSEYKPSDVAKCININCETLLSSDDLERMLTF